MKIGVVDLDTSHPGNWIPIERELGHEVVGVWDGGSVHPPEYVSEFARKHEIPRVFESLEAMVPEVDGVVIHGCNWDTHVEKARPFVEAGKSVLVDKPVAGKLRDLNQFRRWAEEGARIAGGSSLRYCEETAQYLAQPVEKRGIPDTVICGCGVDEFNYGIHAYSMLCGIMGPGAVSARFFGEGIQGRIEVAWPDGRCGLLVIGKAEAWLPFYATVVTGKTATQFTGGANLYRALLTAVLPYLAGETDEPPTPVADLLESELLALAARRSRNEGGGEVRLAELREDDEGYDGAAFAVEYRSKK
jgi:hypothetical protein